MFSFFIDFLVFGLCSNDLTRIFGVLETLIPVKNWNGILFLNIFIWNNTLVIISFCILKIYDNQRVILI